MKVALALGAVVAVVAGCDGADQRFTKADAMRIAGVQPAAPGWAWPRNAGKPAWSSASASSGSSEPALAEFRRKTASVISVGEADKRWQDADKLANLDVGVYGSASDAHKALAPFNTLTRTLAARAGRILDAGPVDGIGAETWRLRVAGNGPQVTYHWRRGNLVVEAHVHCFGRCPADADAAARTWVDAIDAAAQARS